MDIFFFPSLMRANSKSCTVKVFLSVHVDYVLWGFETANPSDMTQISANNTIRATQNGRYYVYAAKGDNHCCTSFRVSHLGVTGYGGGSGSKEDPFLIKNCAHFNNIRSNLAAHYKLMNDLDFACEMENLEWDPIGKYSMKCPKYDDKVPLDEQELGYIIERGFCGEFDGGGHTIKGLVCQHSTKKQIGLFSACGYGAYIHDLSMVECSFIAQDETESVGTVVGLADNCILDGCHISKCDISASLIGGGLIGEGHSQVHCKCCSYSGTLSAWADGPLFHLGGIAGLFSGNDEGKNTVHDCRVDARITAPASSFGGISGIANGRIQILRCLFSGEIHGGKNVAGIIADGDHATVESCVCMAHKIVAAKTDYASITESFWAAERTANNALVLDNKGSVVSQFVLSGIRNNVGRITCTDHIVCEADSANQNYSAEFCKMHGKTKNFQPVNGSVRDGTTVTQDELASPQFYKKIGWDIASIWEIGNGRPVLRSNSMPANPI